jgi:hypothetical protein
LKNEVSRELNGLGGYSLYFNCTFAYEIYYYGINFYEIYFYGSILLRREYTSSY